ncbi:MAG: hypothetical protein SPJ13_07240 [Bacteroidales bacterium]|nr:hypothetical protein [Bacteroidales bacterium]
MYKQKKKVRSVKWWVRTVVLSVIGLILLATLLRRLIPDPNAEDAAGYIMPGTLTRDYRGFDAIRFNFFVLRSNYSGQPPLVHVAYNYILFCVTCTLLFILALTIVVGVRKRGARYLNELKKQYAAKLKEVLLNEEILSSGRIYDILQTNECHLQLDVYPSWLKLLQEIHDEDINNNKHKEYIHTEFNHKNLQNLAQSIGLLDYFEEVLLNAVPGKQYVAIEYLRLLKIKVHSSTVSRLLTHENNRLRKVARHYYMTLDSEDPYSVLKNNNFYSHFSDWDAISLHNTVKSNVGEGKNIPPFRDSIECTTDEYLKQRLIEEAGYWVDEENMAYLMHYLHDNRPEFRSAMYRSIAHSRYKAAEPVLLKNYENEPVDRKILIVNTLVACDSGLQADFFLKAYSETTSHKLKRELLRAMKNYNRRSIANFEKLRREAQPDEALLFEHVLYH